MQIEARCGWISWHGWRAKDGSSWSSSGINQAERLKWGRYEGLRHFREWKGSALGWKLSNPTSAHGGAVACSYLMVGSILPAYGQGIPGTGRTKGAPSLGHQPLDPSQWGCVGNLDLPRAGKEEDGRCSIYSFMSGFVPSSC